jgi:hypothetical protein
MKGVFIQYVTDSDTWDLHHWANVSIFVGHRRPALRILPLLRMCVFAGLTARQTLKDPCVDALEMRCQARLIA